VERLGRQRDRRSRARAADGMVKTGLAAQGYTYINIDDAWEAGWQQGPNGSNDVTPAATPNGEILTNEKFPDMKGLVDYIHGKGLKAGDLHRSRATRPASDSPPASARRRRTRGRSRSGASTISSTTGAAIRCRPTRTVRSTCLQKPYILMRGVLDTLDRDIVYSLCQYGWGKVWEWGDQVGGNLWRVTGDINDNWWSMSSIGFQQTGHEKYAGPGHWNDTDMLVVGHLGWGRINRRARPASRRTSSSRTSRCGRCRRRRSSSAPT
jgi:alpha-galactosidase